VRQKSLATSGELSGWSRGECEVGAGHEVVVEGGHLLRLGWIMLPIRASMFRSIQSGVCNSPRKFIVVTC
jgi:hypothetical protein